MSDLPRQTVVRPLGLITQPNQYGQYADGALRVARNFVMRDPGKLLQAPAIQDIVTVGVADARLEQLIPLDAGHVYTLHRAGTQWSVYENTNTVTLPSSITTTQLFSPNGRISWARVRERLMLNSLQGYLVGDKMAPTNATERALRLAGLPQPMMYGWSATSTDGAAIPANVVVGYRAIFRREYGDGYDLKSVPTPTFKYRNPGPGPRNMAVTVHWLPTVGIQAGDRIELFRSKGTPTNSDNTDPDPSFFRVVSYTLTAEDIAGSDTAGTVTLVDRQMMFPIGTYNTPGEALYTNANQETSDYSNDQPPVAKCTASFQGFCFYGNITERPQLELYVPGGMGTQSVAVANGVPIEHFKKYAIGQREGACAIAGGAAVITGIAAADLVGIKVGQRWSGAPSVFPATARVVNIGPTSISMSAAALTDGTSFALSDAIEIEGVTPAGISWTTVYRAADLADLFHSVGAALASDGTFDLGAYELDCTVAIPTAAGVCYSTGAEITVRPIRHGTASQLNVRATNGALYSPPLPEMQALAKSFDQVVTPNIVHWSKEQQPEHAPAVSSLYCGFGELYALRATRDALWAECSDGLFRISGDAGANGQGRFAVNYANSSLILAGPQASCVLQETLYGYYNVGVCAIDSTGAVQNLTDQRIGDILPGTRYRETPYLVMQANETDEEILLIDAAPPLGGDIAYVWNTTAKGWTHLYNNNFTPPLYRMTALAMQRSPAAGEPRFMFGASVPGLAPQYGGWNHPTQFLEAAVQFQALYADDPASVKQWQSCDFFFGGASHGKTFVPVYNGVAYSEAITIQAFDAGAYARAGIPSRVSASSSISLGVGNLSASTTQSSFQGLSAQFRPLTNMSKKK